MYSNEGYSQDGIVWNSYGNNISGYPVLTNAGNLHLLGFGSLPNVYVSEDGGQTFDVYPQNFSARIYGAVAFDYGNDGIVFATSNFNCPGLLVRSENGKDNWMDLTSKLSNGLPSLVYVEAAIENRVVTYACDNWWITKNNEWKVLARGGRRVCSLPDGSLFTSGGSRSIDGGETWTSFEVPLGLETEIRINANGIYFLDFRDRLWRSQDNGESFEYTLFETGKDLSSLKVLASS